MTTKTFNINEITEVIFFNKESGEEVLKVSPVLAEIEFEQETKPEFRLDYSGAWELTGEIVSSSVDIINVQHLARLLLGKYHWVHSEVNRLDAIRKRTKNKRIKNKLRKRILQLILDQWSNQ
jgi:hypothetical protein